MENAEIADRLEAFAALLELADANPYTMRAIAVPRRRSGARPRPSRSLCAPGGRASCAGSAGASSRGSASSSRRASIAELEELEREIAPDLVGLGRYLGLGARRSVEVARALGVRTADEFREAAAAGRLGSVKGIGAKTERQLLEALAGGRAAPRRGLL